MMMRQLLSTIILVALSLVQAEQQQQQQQDEVEQSSGQQQQQNNQVQGRVYENIDNFMSHPVTTLQIFADFLSLGGFPNNLGAEDQDLAIKYLYSITGSNEEEVDDNGMRPFYGLENGLLLGYWHSDLNKVPVLVYREPGNSGYDPVTSPLSIYADTCVHAETGEEQRCQLETGDPYISCGNDDDKCSLVPCDSLDNLTDPTTHDCSQLTDTEEQNDCINSSNNSNIIWCQNYTIEYTTSDETLGYVPMTLSCINDQGDFSQTPGQVLIETPEGIVENGTCTYDESGVLVNRTLTGPFASCANEPDGICNTTFVGGYDSRQYDPRWREWYTESRKYQRPLFSDPYVFITPLNIGITYTYPIHQSDDQGRTVFAGVLAVDMVLDDIGNFLTEEYNNTGYYVAVYEDREPYFMIGVSTGRSVVGYVRTDGSNQSCSQEQIDSEDGLCMVVQQTIYNFTQEYHILTKVHEAFEDIGNDFEQIVAVHEDDEDLDSTVVLGTALVYEQPDANLKWRIVVVAPIGKNPDASVTKDDGLFFVILVFSILGFSVCFGLFVAFFRRRKEQAVQFADVQFTSAFILGNALLNLSTLTFLGPNTDQLCLLRMWSSSLLFSMSLSPLFVKAFRIWKLLGTSTIILLAFTFADPPVATEEIDLDARIPTQSVNCEYNSDAFYITEGAFHFLLLSIGCLLAYLTRNIDPQFGDARALLFAMYNIFFTFIMVAIIFAVVDISESGRHMLQMIGVFWATVFSSAGFALPRLAAAKEDRKQAKVKMSRMRRMMTQNMKRKSSMDLDHTFIHGTDDSIKILVCTANIGNAPPSLDSMKAWIPEKGSCDRVNPLEGEQIKGPQFDLIVIGMQEATWSAQKKKKENVKSGESSVEQRNISEFIENSKGANRNESEDDVDSSEGAQQREAQKEHYLSAVEGEDTVVLRKMLGAVLGEEYAPVAQEVRGQMRLYIYALKNVVPFIEDLKVSGANTGIGNVLANKGAIVISFIHKSTRFTFLSAHLAAHEGESYYKARCENVYDILKASKTFELSQRIDLSLASHHMFVLGDLNFRTKFDSVNKDHKENVSRALEMIEAKDWKSLYNFDELHRAVESGDLLVGFKTLPCNFNPTFKLKREDGFVYNEQRTPSYTDRILFRSSPGLEGSLKPISYEPCVGFTTSDHKPIRGAFSLAPNDMFEPRTISGRIRLVFSDIECSNLLAGDLNGLSDPYVKFVWDHIDMTHAGNRRLACWGRSDWPRTSHRTRTLNPKWTGKEISMDIIGQINAESMLYVIVYDYDFMGEDDVLGTLPLGIQNLVEMKDGQEQKELVFDRPLERFGKFGGRIMFKLEVSNIVG